MPQQLRPSTRKTRDVIDVSRELSKEGGLKRILSPDPQLDPDAGYPPPPEGYGGVDPPVVGDPQFLGHAKKLFEQYPRLRRQISRMIQGPTSGSSAVMTRSNLPVDTFAGTTLQGVFNEEDNSIGISPTAEDPEMTMFHEAGHAAGLDEIGARMLMQVDKGIKSRKRQAIKSRKRPR